MILLFLPLLFAAACGADVTLIDNWECGSAKVPFSRFISQVFTLGCNFAVQDGTNLCCKAHDFCYEAHATRGFTRDYCDTRFCNCLQDVRAKFKDYGPDECSSQLNGFCALVRDAEDTMFTDSKPIYYNEYMNNIFPRPFVSQQPLNLDMRSLANACPYSKLIAVHCHNSVYRCTQKQHDRAKRLGEEESIVRMAWEDCRTTMHDCLQTIIDYEDPEGKCSKTARSLIKQVNVYTDLDEAKHGKAIIEAFPILAARMLKQCRKSTNALETCFLAFDTCASNNRQERPEYYNAPRRIKLECHRTLNDCLTPATSGDNAEACMEARTLASNSLREISFVPEKSIGESTWAMAGDLAKSGAKWTGKFFGAVGKSIGGYFSEKFGR